MKKFLFLTLTLLLAFAAVPKPAAAEWRPACMPWVEWMCADVYQGCISTTWPGDSVGPLGWEDLQEMCLDAWDSCVDDYCYLLSIP